MANIEADPFRLRRARELFVFGDSWDILCTRLEGLGAELSNRWRAIGQGQCLSPAMRDYVDHARILSDAISYASERLTEVFFRQQQIGWMRDALAYETTPDLFAQASDPKAISWHIFMGLAIKDFHTDLGSLLDALAPVVIQAECKLESKDKDRLPGWSAVQKGTDRSYRQRLTDDLHDIVDGTDRWWPAIKKVRDLLTHREHDKIIFGNSEDGLLFQVYDQSRHPKILLPVVLYREGDNVVDFDLYSAFVIAEVVTLFDDLGNAIATKMRISQKLIAQMFLRMVDKSVVQSVEREVGCQ